MVERFAGFFSAKQSVNDEGMKIFSGREDEAGKEPNDATFAAIFSGALLMNPRQFSPEEPSGSSSLVEGLTATPEPAATEDIFPAAEIGSVVDYLLTVSAAQTGDESRGEPVFASPVDLADLTAATRNRLATSGDEPGSNEMRVQIVRVLKEALAQDAGPNSPLQAELSLAETDVQPVLLAVSIPDDDGAQQFAAGFQVSTKDKTYLIVDSEPAANRPVELIGHPVREKQLQNFIPVQLIDNVPVPGNSDTENPDSADIFPSNPDEADSLPAFDQKDGNQEAESLSARAAVTAEDVQDDGEKAGENAVPKHAGAGEKIALKAADVTVSLQSAYSDVQPEEEGQNSGTIAKTAEPSPSPAPPVSAESSDGPVERLIRENDSRLQAFINRTEAAATPMPQPPENGAVQLDLFAEQARHTAAAPEQTVSRQGRWADTPRLMDDFAVETPRAGEENDVAASARPVTAPAAGPKPGAPGTGVAAPPLREVLNISVLEVTRDTLRDNNGQVYLIARKMFETAVVPEGGNTRGLEAPELMHSTRSWRAALQDAISRLDRSGAAEERVQNEQKQAATHTNTRAFTAYNLTRQSAQPGLPGAVPPAPNQQAVNSAAQTTAGSTAQTFTGEEQPVGTTITPGTNGRDEMTGMDAKRTPVEHTQKTGGQSETGTAARTAGAGTPAVPAATEHVDAKTISPARPAGKTSPHVAVTSERFENIRLQIADQVQPDKSVIRIVLKPESMGTIRLTLSLQEGVLAARFLVDTAETRALLESGMDSLKTTLQEKGIRADTVQVSLPQSGQQVSRSEQGSQTSAQDQQKDTPAGDQEQGRKRHQKKQQQGQQSFDRYL